MWKSNLPKLKNSLVDVFFPKLCLGCQREGSWLCEDCVATLEIQNWVLCPVCQKRVLDFKTCARCKPKTGLTGLFTPVSFENALIKKAIHQFKYEPFLKELAEPLANIIISYLGLAECSFLSPEFILVPVPLHKSRLRWRGFNQAEEIAKELSKKLEIPLTKNLLIRNKPALPQAELEKEARLENIKGIFSCPNQGEIKKKKILLVDDVYTTGATMEECAKVLRSAGAKEIWGAVVARG